MWKNVRSMNRINEDISGIWTGNHFSRMPHYVRYNEDMPPERVFEYTTEEQPEIELPEEIYETATGKIVLEDKGEFGGCLRIGGRFICPGNFSKIFRYKGKRYVIDDLQHMMSCYFRLFEIDDDGSVRLIYDADEYSEFHKKYDKKNGSYGSMSLHRYFYFYDEKASDTDKEKHMLDKECNVGLDAFYVGRDYIGDESMFFLCSGYMTDYGKDRRGSITRVSYLLKYNPDAPKPIVRVDIPYDIVEFGYTDSIWTDGVMLAIGCDKEVAIVHLPTMETEYYTELAKEEVEELLKEKENRNYDF